ncbi:hypothetical protein DFH11DRAFT_1724869 [Phellopilus nigrolimitatus]|nr:hypothetical protein DFH11DRAFT_1724869 [Phellopilus nigrolimitatus]
MSTAAVIPALDNTFGCLFLASIATIGLWGAGSVQAYYYFDIYSNDGYFLKAHVFVVWALDTAHQALILHSTYTYLVTNYANPVYLEHFTSTLRDSIILTGLHLPSGAVPLCRPDLAVKRNYVLTGVVACLTLAQFASTVVYYAKAYHVKDFAALSTIFVVSCTINVITAVADATIAAVLIYLLQSNRTGFKRTDTIIHKLIAYTIHTGLPTGICAIVSLITGIVLRHTFITILFYLLLSRLYMNSMLAAMQAVVRRQETDIEAMYTQKPEAL